MDINRREQVELYIPLFLSWTVYALAQRDIILPALAVILTLPSLLVLVTGKKKNGTPGLKFSARNIIYVSLLAGVVWRNIVPPPEDAVAFVPVLASTVQSSSVIVAVFMWFSLSYSYRPHFLKFLSWLTVASSVNVPFGPLLQISFWLFCVTSVCIIMLPAYFPYSPELKEKFKRAGRKSVFLYSYPASLFIISSLVFISLINGIKAGDEIFMDFVAGYITRGRYRYFDPKLLLSGAGAGRTDIRPIMEVEKKDNVSGYLAGQVFDTYDDGLWEAPWGLPLKSLPGPGSPLTDSGGARPYSGRAGSVRTLKVFMYEYLNDVIPAPRGVAAVKGKDADFEIDPDGIVFSKDKKIPAAVLFLDGASLRKTADEIDVDRYLRIGPFMKENLRDAVAQAGGDAGDPRRAAANIEGFFRRNFGYTLDPGFMADNKGILYMIYGRNPAYCSYFATAMVLMLRARGIPARMVSGFFAAEVSSWDKNRYIVRGRDAHAWVEAFLPLSVGKTGGKVINENGDALYSWTRFDPTPPDSRLEAIEEDTRINKLADWIWCSQKRLRAAILNIETKSLVKLFLLFIFFLICREILAKLIKARADKSKAKTDYGQVKGDKSGELCSGIYKKFEDYLKTRYNLSREDAETSGELIARMKKEGKTPRDAAELIEEFFIRYHSARFGFNSAEDVSLALVDMLDRLTRDAQYPSF